MQLLNSGRCLVRAIRKIGARRVGLMVGMVWVLQIGESAEPVVRIGIGRGLDAVSITSSEPFEIDGSPSRSVRFETVITVDSGQERIGRDDLDTRMAIDMGDEQLWIRPVESTIRIVPGAAPLRFNGRMWRGDLEVIGRADGEFTVVNELPLEDYLLGVVPNELGPEAFPELEALKAQAIAARTYIVRNLGQFADEGFDICATEQCQVYFGLDTEHEVATRAVQETRGMIATFEGEPIIALYSSTCGGRTEDAGNVFGEHVPYLVSVECGYEHPEPYAFETRTVYDSWEQGLLGIAGVDDFADAGRFMGLEGVGEPSANDVASVAAFVRETFFPDVPTASDELFLQQQGILVPGENLDLEAIMVRLLVRKRAFEWQDARLISWDGEVFRARVDGGIRDLALAPDAPLFVGLGDSRVPATRAVWVGGEFMQARIVDGVVRALVYEPLPGVPAADRFSPVAHWEERLTRDDLDERVAPLGIGGLEDIVILERGASGRVVSAEFRGTLGSVTLPGPRVRTLLGLRDSLIYIDSERNSRRELLGMAFFGGGWGHGVGMCQVGAFGMAMDGSTAEDILKAYYTGIEVEAIY